jgi:hypothetical protein
VQRDELRDHREADAASRHRCGHRALEPLVRLPDPVAMLRRNSGALVVDDQTGVVSRAAQRDRHRLADRSVLHRVVEQIEEDLAQRARVRDAHDVRLERRLDHDVPRPRHRPEHLHRLAHLRRQLRRHRRELDRLPLRPRELQNVLDEMRQRRAS